MTIDGYGSRLVQCVNSSHYDNVVTCVPLCLMHYICVQGCLGALDGTHINVLVNNSDKPWYRTRKGSIATNVLAVYDRDMQFVYILPGWEGSAGDSRVLRDAVSRQDSFRVPQGQYNQRTVSIYH